jgi:hypothetical protein
VANKVRAERNEYLALDRNVMARACLGTEMNGALFICPLAVVALVCLARLLLRGSEPSATKITAQAQPSRRSHRWPAALIGLYREEGHEGRLRLCYWLTTDGGGALADRRVRRSHSQLPIAISNPALSQTSARLNVGL